MDLLDNPVWHALGASDPTVGDDANGPRARRYHPDVAPFAALPDHPSPHDWDALRDLVGAGNVAVLLRVPSPEPDGWVRVDAFPGLQMLPGTLPPVPKVDAVELGTDDVDDMLALVARTRPGPFGPRTLELGTYLGVRDGGRLVAMGGERMRPAGYAEISAVCVDESRRRSGLAGALVGALVDRISARGDRPFLHLAASNEVALRTYQALGFTVRTTVDIPVLAAPA